DKADRTAPCQATHPHFARMAQGVAVTTDDEVALLEAEYALRVHAERFQAIRLSALAQGAPEMDAAAGGNVYLVAKLADITDPQQACGNPGDGGRAHAHKRERRAG